VLIEGATIYDGTEADPYVADIGIKADRIAAVGDLSGVPAGTVIDARGLTATPGFIDVHNHTDVNILMKCFKPDGELDVSPVTEAWRDNHNYSTQGVTTIVTGLCGGGFWEVDGWLDFVKSQTFASNVYHLVPYGMLRMLYYEYIHQRPQPQAPLPANELEDLKAMVEDRMKQGAIGLSVGLEYAPDCFTDLDELVAVAGVVQRYGGLFDAHIRDQTGPKELESIRELIKVGQLANIPVHISHIQVNLPWEGVTASEMLDLIGEARAGGVDVTADQHPYERGYGIISYRLPRDFKTAAGVKPEYCDRENHPDLYEQLRDAAADVLTKVSPDRIWVIDGDEHVNETIAKIAGDDGDPAETYLHFCCKERAPNGIFDEISGAINEEVMPHDYVFTASDGFTTFGTDDSPHPRFFGCFPNKIRMFAKEKKILTLKAAVRSMTSLPAAKFKIRGRGVIARGMYADIAVIDMGDFSDHGDYTKRSEYSTGVIHLLVNGVMTIDNGRFTGDRGGKALMRGE
jgi:N-acyl-D-aspartate/D-glutamate deacylase